MHLNRVGFTLCFQKDLLSAPSADPSNLSFTLRTLLRLVMSSSSSDPYDSVVNVESFITRTASGSAREVSGSDNSIDRSSEGLSYKKVDSSVLKIPTSFRDSNSLDNFLSKNSFIKPDYPSDAVMTHICGHID